MVICDAYTMRTLIAFVVGVGIGMLIEYLNVLFWKKYAYNSSKIKSEVKE